MIIDTFVSEPQGKGALDEDRPGWVVVGQGSLLIRSLDSWCGYTHAQVGPWLMGSAQRPREPTQQAWWESSPHARALPTMWGSAGSAAPVESLEEGICKEEEGWKLVAPSPYRRAGEKNGEGDPSEFRAPLGLRPITQAHPFLISIHFGTSCRHLRCIPRGNPRACLPVLKFGICHTGCVTVVKSMYLCASVSPDAK